MPKIAIIVGIGFAIVAALWYGAVSTEDVSDNATEHEGETFVVTLRPDGYDPAEFTIAVGTKVTFVSVTGKPHWPASNLHPTHDIYPAFDPKVPLDPDESWSFVFDKPGEWNFHDHLRAYYTGTVNVTAQ